MQKPGNPKNVKLKKAVNTKKNIL